MAEFFSDAWMNSFMEEWNKEPDLADALSKINFTSNIGYGLLDEDQARGFVVVENGKVKSAGAYNGEELNWDLRASQDNWDKWMTKGLGMAGLGMAYVGGKLKFKTGDYKAMVKDPRMAGPFVKTFTVMGRVKA
ncbi:SCP-2 sterol transfer family protein [Candidatus Marithrix sp. Canyon 246]|uniref:SCP-2 sterol transfer family protein n=1 Tax=Candidatus Marithrix sp. Canyon 246 TaxID=1827136 RepID=UPI00084A0A5A|nr:SCP-2 sterol transfer family protein [Candidatus Marithrix sp. Canyon 246]